MRFSLKELNHLLPKGVTFQHIQHEFWKQRNPSSTTCIVHDVVGPSSLSFGHEPPAFAQGPSQRPGAQQPDAEPQGQHEEVVLHASWHPFAPEFFVALEKCRENSSLN